MGDLLPKVKVAAVQASPVFLNREATVGKACRLIAEAAGRGAQLVVFPETWVPGYPVWSRFIPPLRVTKALHRVWACLYRNAGEVPSLATEELGQAARRAGVYVVIGINEREAQFGHGTLYNTLLYLDPRGRVLGKHRKLVPTFQERTVWGQGDASGLRVHPSPLGRLGGLICWEHWMPLARYTLYSQGEQIHTALWPSSWAHDTVEGEMFQVASRHYAHEGRVFVIVACGYLTRDQLPADFELAREAERWPHLLLHGGSAIIAPEGRYIAGPVYEGEETLYAELDLSEIAENKMSLDVVGHYARPDLFRLIVNDRRQTPLERQEARGWEETVGG